MKTGIEVYQRNMPNRMDAGIDSSATRLSVMGPVALCLLIAQDLPFRRQGHRCLRRPVALTNIKESLTNSQG